MTDYSRDAGAQRPVCHTPWPVRGQIVTFLRGGRRDVPNFDRAVATGDVIVDPDTGSRWLPVILLDLAPALLDITTVIDFESVRKTRHGDDHPGEQGQERAS
jgi:hypothetical protein